MQHKSQNIKNKCCTQNNDNTGTWYVEISCYLNKKNIVKLD